MHELMHCAYIMHHRRPSPFTEATLRRSVSIIDTMTCRLSSVMFVDVLNIDGWLGSGPILLILFAIFIGTKYLYRVLHQPDNNCDGARGIGGTTRQTWRKTHTHTHARTHTLARGRARIPKQLDVRTHVSRDVRRLFNSFITYRRDKVVFNY